MLYTALKVLITAVLVVAVSEAGKKSALAGGVLASLPIVSFLGMTWLYIDTGDSEKVADLARTVFWLVLPSLPVFLLLPYLLNKKVNFFVAMGASTAVLVSLYGLLIVILVKFRIHL